MYPKRKYFAPSGALFPAFVCRRDVLPLRVGERLRVEPRERAERQR